MVKRNKQAVFFSVSRPLAALCFSAMLTLGVFGQQPAGAEEEVLRIDTDLVTFEAVVTDEKGAPVRGLKAANFRLFENGVEKPISFFEPLKKNAPARPLAIVFGVDVSGSVTSEEILKLKAALQKFADRLGSYESYFAVLTFGMDVRSRLPFTKDPRKLEKVFDKIARDEAGLSTHTYDAADDAIRLLQRKAPRSSNNKPTRKVVILITDGFPVGDTVAPQTVIERANEAETTIYTVTLPSYAKNPALKKPLLTPLDVSGLAEKTGGGNFYAIDRDFEPLFQALAEEITSTYLVAFYPDEEKRTDGKFHQVRIEAKGYQLKQNRAGYQIVKDKKN
jgi:VWFA-related protein